MNNECVKEDSKKSPKEVHITILVNIAKNAVDENVTVSLVHS